MLLVGSQPGHMACADLAAAKQKGFLNDQLNYF